MTTATPTTEAFEAKYQRSAEDPTSAEMLAIFSEGWNARGTFPEALMPEPVATVDADGFLVVLGSYIPTHAKRYTADHLHAVIRAATERAAKQERADGVLISAYALPVAASVIDHVRIERASQMAGPDLWAVRFRGDVLNKQGDWEWEPMPSGRDDDFIERARFSTAEEGIAAAIRASGGMGAGS
jgi:hypothetical protein